MRRKRIRPEPSRSAVPSKIMLGGSGVAAEAMVTVPEPDPGVRPPAVVMPSFNSMLA